MNSALRFEAIALLVLWTSTPGLCGFLTQFCDEIFLMLDTRMGLVRLQPLLFASLAFAQRQIPLDFFLLAG